MVHLIFSVAQISICHWRWVLMPPEVLPDAFLCDESCSKGKEDDINVLSWYTHVLPQIRHRWSSWKMSNWHQQCWSPLLEHTFEATRQKISLNCSKGSSMETRWRSLCRVQERQYICRYVQTKIGFLLKTHFQGHLAHAVMNIDENLSVTENLFLPDSLEDWVHGWAEKSLKDLFKAFF